MMQKVLITGSAGLIGSETVHYFCQRDFEVHGLDNDLRKYFFGPEASTEWNRRRLEEMYQNYIHHATDIRDSEVVAKIFRHHSFDLIVHTAAQPSHDWAAGDPFTDFSVNATGTLVLLEHFRKFCPEAVFIFTSTNKVYGDRPNELPLQEMETRYELPEDHTFYKGIDESMSIDYCKHSLFGVSKAAADLMVQEYGKYFNLKTAAFRGGCLTGPAHSGAELHGFLAYLVKCVNEGRQYTIYGYKGKQVRDNIHSHDLVSCFDHFFKNPRCGEVYNIGGARHSNISMQEAITAIERLLGKKAIIKYDDNARNGDHIWYISDVSKFKSHYPDWDFEYSMDDILEEMCRAVRDRNS